MGRVPRKKKSSRVKVGAGTVELFFALLAVEYVQRYYHLGLS